MTVNGSTATAYEELLARLELQPQDFPHLLEAESWSRRRIAHARGCLSDLRVASGVVAFALGSYGRGEASEASDLDLAVLYDESRADLALAQSLRAQIVERLRKDFEILEKTFRAPIALQRLLRNVGGAHDSNQTLTYRALLLTESAWLLDSVQADAFRADIYAIYTGGTVSRGRFSSSLGNDLHRYYRTLCVDYRFKVEENEKSWALRVLKLRHTRKLWHLANLCVSCWGAECVEDSARDREIAGMLGRPPLHRIAHTLLAFGVPAPCLGLLRAYDRFLGATSSQSVRECLDALSYPERYESAIYRSLHDNAERLDEAAAAVVEVLWTHARAHLVRFCVL